MLSTALSYAEAGWKVFPVKENCKKPPALANGFHGASSSPEQIKRWWEENPRYNVAIRTGSESGIFVLDIDCKNGKNGFIWVDAQGDMPNTVVQTTPSGGKQYFFNMPDFAVFCSSDKLAPGVDIRADGGYTMAPPSVLVETKDYQYSGHYEWLDSQDPESMPVANAPDWLLNALIDLIPPPAKESSNNHIHSDISIPIQSVIDKYNISLKQVKPGVYAGAHPVHGSSNGENFRVDTNKDVWACYRHTKANGTPVGGGSLQLIAMMEGLLDCPACISGALKGKNFPPVLNILKSKFGYNDYKNIAVAVSYPNSRVPAIAAIQVNTDGDLPLISDHAQYEIQKQDLAITKGGIPICNIDNVQRALFYIYKDLYFDEFHGEVFKPNGERWTKKDTLDLTTYFQRNLGLININSNIVDEGVEAYSYQNKRNEPFDYMESLEWDKTPRIENFLTTCAGAKNTEYTRAISKNFWISLVCRVYNPGVKVDNMLILEGPQGRLKSTLFEVVGGRWYAAVEGSIDHKDFYICLQGKLLIEFAELSSFYKTELNKLKHIITSRIDRYRGMWDKRASDHPRQCIFTGTTNKQQYLKDDTGGRRFWPIKTGEINIELIKQDRDQLYAEAVFRFKNRESWWVMPSATSDEQESRRLKHPWEQIIKKWISLRPYVSTNDIMSDCLLILPKDRTKTHEMEIGEILCFLKWEHKQVSINKSRQWIYLNPAIKSNFEEESEAQEEIDPDNVKWED